MPQYLPRQHKAGGDRSLDGIRKHRRRGVVCSFLGRIEIDSRCGGDFLACNFMLNRSHVQQVGSLCTPASGFRFVGLLDPRVPWWVLRSSDSLTGSGVHVVYGYFLDSTREIFHPRAMCWRVSFIPLV